MGRSATRSAGQGQETSGREHPHSCSSSSPPSLSLLLVLVREVTILEKGVFWVGVTRRSKDALEKHLGERANSWGLFSGPGGGDFQVGDVISISYDLSGIRAELLFSVNGVPTGTKVNDVKGDVYPAVSVSDGAALQANFGATGYKVRSNAPVGDAAAAAAAATDC